MRKWCGAALLSAVIACDCSTERPAPAFILATTTSVGHSGLLDTLLAAFEQQDGIRVRVHLVGSGHALRMLETGRADAVISHAPELEAAALRAHPEWWYRKIMFNDFLLVGPLSDPAGVTSAPTIAVAMRQIAARGAQFISRGDESGTHARERQLWKLAGVTPSPDRVVIAGTGMAQTLRIASEVGAYTLTDRATYLRLADRVSMTVVFEGGPELLNTYAAIINSSVSPAMRFGRWVAQEQGRDLIARASGFTAWPHDKPRERPSDVPH